ncbi:MAG: alpha/beta hydrolase [Cyclobacteriaceae bacterium]|nr:alpha/beta hydrolase [Cyclobacteriaceae bacterium]
MKEQRLHFDFEARYYTLGELTKDTKQVWFVLHGYGQLAKYFIKKFETLEHKGVYVIAPEGLSHFYLEDIPTRVSSGSNRVGATWMTRENREMDIQNYISYLQSIYDLELNQIDKPSVSIFGFSQGGATATRWALSGKPHFNKFILWAGVFPPDMNFESGKKILKGKKVITVYGDNDPFVTPERMKEMEYLSSKIELTPKKITFHGKHEIDDKTLLSLVDL